MDSPGVFKLEEKMSICSSPPQDHGGYTNCSWLESDLQVRKCHAIENLYVPKIEAVKVS